MVWPELFFLSPSCVSQVITSEWEGAFFLTNSSQLRDRQKNEPVGCDPRSGWVRNIYASIIRQKKSLQVENLKKKHPEFEKEEQLPKSRSCKQTECLPNVCEVPANLLFKTQLGLLTTIQNVRVKTCVCLISFEVLYDLLCDYGFWII